MASQNMTLAAFLRDRIGLRAKPGTFEAFERLGGVKLGRAKLYRELAEAQEHIEPWMPIFFLPAGTATFTAGIHLRPSDVAAGRLALMTADEEGEMIEVAGSLEAFVYRGLAESEGYANEGGGKIPQWLKDGIAKANEVLGGDFYQLGRHGNFTSTEADRLMIDVFGGSPNGFHDLAIFTDDPKPKLAAYERGIKVEPGCMMMYAGAVKALITLGDRRRAAEMLARSLDCYHYTAYSANLAEYFELGRELLAEFPDPFGEDARWELGQPDPRNWARRASELFKAGQVERADKVLNDMCFGIRDYAGALGAFRKHYEKLGWKWALALCDLRS